MNASVLYSFGVAWLLFAASNFHLVANGVVNFHNLPAPPEKLIYRGDWVYRGNGQYDFVYFEPCNGPNYRVALYWGPAGITDDRQLVQVGASVGFLTGAGAGKFAGGNRTIATPGDGPVLSFQLRAWDGSSGATSYEQAIAGPNAVAGRGPVFELDTKDPANNLEISPNIWQAPGFRGFIFGSDGVTQVIVPEPSTLALGALAVAALLLFRRHNRP